MIRNIKAVGLAIVAVAAMSMAAAASAQASELHATSQTGKATITGHQLQQHTFVTDAGTVTCSQATFEGTIQGPIGTQITAQELQVTPTYVGCQGFGLAAQVIMHGCKYTITNKSAAGVTTAKKAFVDITGCTAGKQITVIAGGGACVATVPEQHHLGHLGFADKGTAGTSTEDVEVNVTVTGIKYELHGAFCPGGGATGLRSNGTYHGTATFGAYVDQGTALVTKHGHQYTEHLDNGVQVGLRST